MLQAKECGQRVSIIIVSEGATDLSGQPITANQVKEVWLFTFLLSRFSSSLKTSNVLSCIIIIIIIMIVIIIIIIIIINVLIKVTLSCTNITGALYSRAYSKENFGLHGGLGQSPQRGPGQSPWSGGMGAKPHEADSVLAFER